MVKDYLQAADIFISTAVSEGLPNTVLEALSSGLPCILSDIGPHREIIEKNVGAGKLFKLRDSVELSKIMEDYST